MSDIELMSVKDLCEKVGIDLQGLDGKPYCCGSRMTVKSGICGADYAECKACGKTIGNATSPHINGGFIRGKEWFDEHGDRTWYLMRSGNCEDVDED